MKDKRFYKFSVKYKYKYIGTDNEYTNTVHVYLDEGNAKIAQALVADMYDKEGIEVIYIQYNTSIKAM